MKFYFFGCSKESSTFGLTDLKMVMEESTTVIVQLFCLLSEQIAWDVRKLKTISFCGAGQESIFLIFQNK